MGGACGALAGHTPAGERVCTHHAGRMLKDSFLILQDLVPWNWLGICNLEAWILQLIYACYFVHKCEK
jgi:hypothetical protein